tara:strand:- start:1861 stop:2403 length:543 start_codon:yes stop_codon:yes gene_type:complete
MHHRINGARILRASICIGVLLPLSTLASANDNPFEFKPKVPVQTVSVVQQLPETRNLSDIQRSEVAEMLLSAALAVSKKNGELKSMKSVVVLQPDDEYTSIASGMYVIYDTATENYRYYDTQKFTDVVSAKEHATQIKRQQRLITESFKAIAESALNEVADNNNKPTTPIRATRPKLGTE